MKGFLAACTSRAKARNTAVGSDFKFYFLKRNVVASPGGPVDALIELVHAVLAERVGVFAVSVPSWAIFLSAVHLKVIVRIAIKSTEAIA